MTGSSRVRPARLKCSVLARDKNNRPFQADGNQQKVNENPKKRVNLAKELGIVPSNTAGNWDVSRKCPTLQCKFEDGKDNTCQQTTTLQPSGSGPLKTVDAN